eukprot:CAMPEP_0182552892 /NCGR_PEP_ID=MMETSP1323-20130603/49208_1 /TAXON_ID=236787 /ORGANISM="Florenciella parvula, Strain RCC1693" /LENGTH=875 /DNA_ID=CAMNT_0024764605 /DNA_START=154 /DNA_END=2781 /DNA_ORIENTATION=+
MMDPVMEEEAMLHCLDQAKARAKAKKAARENPQTAMTIESAPPRNPYSVTVQYQPSLKFAPKKHQQRDSTAYTSTNIIDCHRELQNFSETVEIEAQGAACICVMGRPVDALTGTPYATPVGGQARLTDSGEMLAGQIRDGSLKLRALVKAVVVHNGVRDNFDAKALAALPDVPAPPGIPSSPTQGTNEDEAKSSEVTSEDTTAPKKLAETPSPAENLNQTFADIRNDEAAAAETASKKTAAMQTAMRNAAILRGIASATRGTALAEGHDATGASKYNPNQVIGGAGDLSGIMTAAAARTLRRLKVYKHLMPTTLAQIELDTSDAIDDYVDETLAVTLALSSGMANNIAHFTGLSDELTEPADKLEYVMEFMEGRYRDMSRRATRLRDEDKQDTDEWTNLIKAYAVLNQNDVVVAMGDGLQLQAQFSMMKKILEYLYQDNPTPAIVKYVRDLGSLTPADGSACGSQLGVIEYGANFYSAIDEAINGPCNAPILNAFINESKHITMRKDESMVEYLDRVREILITGPSITAQKSPSIHEALEQAVQTGQLDAVGTVVGGIREWSIRENQPSNFEVQQLCAEYLLKESTTMIPIKDRTVAKQTERLARLRNKVKAITTRHALYSRSTRAGRAGSRPKDGATFRQFAAAAVGNLEETFEETPMPDSNKENNGPNDPPSWVAALLEGLNTVGNKGPPPATALAALEKAMNQKKSPAGKKADKIKPYQILIDHDCDQATIPYDSKVSCNYCGRLGHRQITNGVGTCGRMAYDLLHEQSNAHASDERIKFMESKGWDAPRPAPGTFKIYPHDNGSPQTAAPATGTSGTEDAASEIARLKAQIETLKANNSSNNDNSAMAAQIESTVLNAISAHLSELADDEE